MMKHFSNFLRSRTLGCDRLVGSTINSSYGVWSHNFAIRAGISTAGKGLAADGGNRTFMDYTIFKGKAALILRPVFPKFKETNSGYFEVDKRGSVMLTFMPAIGQKKYDWQKRQRFALNPTEVGSLISLGPADSCEFFHDPSKNTSLEGQVKKTLSVSPAVQSGGYFFNLTVSNSSQNTNERFSVPVTKAEFAVMRTSCTFILPQILGWHGAPIKQPMNMESNMSKQSGLRLEPDLEWVR